MGKIVKKITKNNVEYRLLDYIKGNGTSTYINLGITPKSNTNAELVAYQENDFLGDDRVLLGGGTNWSNNTEFVIGVYRASNKHFFEKGIGGVESGSTQVIGVKNTYKIQDNKAYVNGVDKFTFTNTTINTSYPMYLFALNRHGVSPSTMNYSNARIYSCKIWEGTVLKLDLIPVERVSDNVLGMLDLVSGNLYTNAGTGNFTKGNYIKYVDDISVEKIHITANNELVAEVDYIQSSGTQYLTTNIRPVGNERFEFEFTPLEWSTSTNNVVCGARRGSNGIMVFGSILDVYGGGSRLANFTYNENISKMTLNVKHTVRYERDKMWYDGTQYTATGRQLIEVGYNMILFASSSDGSIAGNTKMKLHSFKEFNSDGSIKENWIPVKVLSTGVYCMLDTISGTLHYNSGTGNFTGPSTKLVKELWPKFTLQNTSYYILDYIQSTGTQYINLGNFSFNANTDVLETKFKFDTISTTPTGTYWLYCSQDSSVQYMHDFYSQNSLFYVRTGLRSSPYTFSQDTNIHTLKIDYANSKIYLDNVEKHSGINKSSLSNMPFRLLGRTTSTSDFTRARIYTFTITRSGTKILDLVPVERFSDNVLGMLDLVSGNFFTNAGTGTFVSGNKRKLTLIE